MKRFCKEHCFLASLLAAAVLTWGGIPVWVVSTGSGALGDWLALGIYCFLPLCGFLAYPIVLTLIELILLFAPGRAHKAAKLFDLLTLGLGAVYTPLYCVMIRNIDLTGSWETQLSNAALHAPIFSGSAPTVITLLLVGLAGYLILTYVPLCKLPPLAVVLSIAGMYLACGVEILWCVQVMTRFDLWLLLLPLNVVVITARTIRYKLGEWNSMEPPSPLLGRFDRLLSHANGWPVFAFVLMWPLLGILICLLVLFGQRPNEIIRAFTETSDWNLSQQTAPQNLYYDEHYLCTVAAGGHKRLVKPLRRGVRHGHAVIVNRQLCVANAFEQILEEKTPRFHRAVRYVYDTCGFPIAKLIHSPYIADVIYLLMKPLEWLFLLVLYAVDTHPEDRIAVQYTGRHVGEFTHTAP